MPSFQQLYIYNTSSKLPLPGSPFVQRIPNQSINQYIYFRHQGLHKQKMGHRGNQQTTQKECHVNFSTITLANTGQF